MKTTDLIEPVLQKLREKYPTRTFESITRAVTYDFVPRLDINIDSKPSGIVINVEHIVDLIVGRYVTENFVSEELIRQIEEVLNNPEFDDKAFENAAKSSAPFFARL